RHAVRQLEGVDRRDREVLGKAARADHADADGVRAEMALARAAIAAMAAGDVAFARDAITNRITLHLAAYRLAHAPELLAHGHRHGNRALRPLVPVVDVDVGAADRGFPHADQQIVRPVLRPLHLLHPDAFFGFGFDECFHDQSRSSL